MKWSRRVAAIALLSPIPQAREASGYGAPVSRPVPIRGDKPRGSLFLHLAAVSCAVDPFSGLGYNHRPAVDLAGHLRQTDLSPAPLDGLARVSCEMEFARCDRRELTVPSRSSLDAKEQIRQAIDIVDLVGSVVQLRRQGRNYVGLCPWHDDSRPSLQVNPERQSFKCWVCDIGGDVFSFMMKMEGVEFPEALAMLADRAGIALEKPRGREAVRTGRGRPGRSGARSTSGPSTRPWPGPSSSTTIACSNSPEAEPARKYLQERGITAESIEQFHLGFSPDRARAGSCQRAGGTPEPGADPGDDRPAGPARRPAAASTTVSAAGCCFPSATSRAGRSDWAAACCRDCSDSPAKYVNSPETPLFSKSHLLYGLDLAREAIRKSRTALVMEGYTDCIVAHQYGFTNAVAVLGTALGEAHIRMLKRFADRIVLVLDGDEAGQRRANEVLELFVAQQVDLRILTLPDELDPCEFLQERGGEAFRQLLETRRSTPWTMPSGRRPAASTGNATSTAPAQALERLVAIVAKAPRLQHDTTGASRLREQKILEQLALALPRRRRPRSAAT